MYKVEKSKLSVAQVVAEIVEKVKNGWSILRRDSETDLPEGTIVTGTVSECTVISDDETKQFFVSVRAKTERGNLFSFILPPDEKGVVDGANVTVTVRKDTKGVGRFRLTAVSAPVQTAVTPAVNAL